MGDLAYFLLMKCTFHSYILRRKPAALSSIPLFCGAVLRHGEPRAALCSSVPVCEIQRYTVHQGVTVFGSPATQQEGNKAIEEEQTGRQWESLFLLDGLV